MIIYQPQVLSVETVHVFDNKDGAVEHVAWDAYKNDTSVVLVANGADFFQHNWARFWGFNAAANVVNASTATLDHVNITVHNGAANVYSYGDNTVVNITNSWLYSSGPVSHGLYASGNGTIHAQNIVVYSDGYRSSAFSGDAPAGYVHVEDAIAHTAGIGSATFYALGVIKANNVISVSEKGPVVFSDGDQKIHLSNCQSKAGLLVGTVMFSSAERESSAELSIEDSTISATGESMPALWFGNLIANAYLSNVELETKSGILVVANFSQITQDFDHWASHEYNNSMEPAEVHITVEDSALKGDLIAYNSSTINMALNMYTSWEGTAYAGYGDAFFGISLDAASSWTLTADTVLQEFADNDCSLSNIHSQGYLLYYNESTPQNKWLSGRSSKLSGGGQLKPLK
ncbi:hypothetical protein BDV59DRAFT_196532 [Aspergillus ambiguus]|uniref:uncharacterized protein n=1 Tax=Aspergillus ambiguus TaxID=176160 RepID=UPI003CCE0672